MNDVSAASKVFNIIVIFVLIGDILLYNAQVPNSLNNNTGVPQHLDNRQVVYTMMDKRLKSEIAQRKLSDLGRGSLAL